MSGAGNPYINLTTPSGGGLPYELQLAQLQRQQRLADQLRQEATDPIAVQSGGGAPAPISWGSILGKVLSGVGASMKEGRVNDQLRQIGVQDSDTASALVRELTRGTNQVGTPSTAPQTMPIDATTPQLPGGPAPAPTQGTLQLPGAAGGQVQNTPPAMPDQLAAILAARGGPQTQMIQQAMLPQILNRQNMDYQHQLGREDKTWENAQPMPVARGQEIAAQGQQAQQNAQFQNQLPMTANERASNALGYAGLNKPMAVPFGGQLYDPRTRSMFTPAGGMGGMNAPQPVDPKSNSLLAQTGLSQAGFDYLTSGRLPRGQALAATTQKEVSDWGRKNNVDTSTMQSTYKANNNVLQSNITRNNQSKILENEIQGTVQSVIPLANAIGQGQINAANLANVWSGKQVNDPQVQQYRDQLLRLRSELAGFNAIAAGKLTEHGQARVDQSDLDEAAQLISSGMNAGGASGLAQSVAMTANKNSKVLQSAVDDATQSVWNQFGVGKNFKRNSQPLSAGGAGTPGGGNIPPPPPGFVVHQ